MKLNTEMFEGIINNMEKPETNIGIVIASIDSYILVNGLYDVYLGEKVIINNNYDGYVFEILEDRVVVFSLQNVSILVGSFVKRTHELFHIEVSPNMLGHVFNILGKCIDGSNYNYSESRKAYIERTIPSIIERKSITEPIETGFVIIDALIPIGKGQRQLLLGNQNTGKTYTAINTFIRNKDDNNAVFIYVAVGQQKAKTARLVDYLRKNDVLEKTIIISADAGEAAINNYLAPYIGCAVAEYFAHDLKKDVIIVYDDLSQQAISYREICLLTRRSPSREAYPGDVFYLHARLLERAGNFIYGGSITALPIAQLQENDLSAYIPTNLISITDGQIIFDTKLFNKGIKPAINTELSVSRVGGVAQHKNIRFISKSLRLELAQFHELELFSQFTSDLDEKTIIKLEKGKLLIELLKQDLYQNYGTLEKYILLYIFKYFYPELFKITDKKQFLYFVFDFIKYSYVDIYNEISLGNMLSEKVDIELRDIIINLFKLYENI